VARTQDVEKSWWCDRCSRAYPLSLAQRRFIAGTGPDVAMPPLRLFEHRSSAFRLCADCELVADPHHPDDYRYAREPGDVRPLYLYGSRRAVTPPSTVSELPQRSPEPQASTAIARSSSIVQLPRIPPPLLLLPVAETVAGFGDEELAYAAKSRSENTKRAYSSDWSEWCAWCQAHGHIPLPAAPDVIARYLTFMVRCQSKVSTMSRRLSAIRFAHITAKMASPLDNADLSAVWDGIRRTHSAPPTRALPLHPPLLWECVEAIPTTNAEGKVLLAGLRDRAVLLVGFVGALRVSELAAVDVEHIETNEKGLVLHIPRSKVNQTGAIDELVVLPRSTIGDRCPVEAIKQWRRATDITTGPLLRGLTKSLQPRRNRISTDALNTIVQSAVARTGNDPSGYSFHSLRAGFVTYASLSGQSDRAIAHQTRHRSLASIGTYVRVQDAWVNNAAVELRL
jgi:integrase